MDRSCPTPLPCRPKPYKTVSFVHKGALCAQNRRFCTEQAAPKAKNSAFATAFREMNHDFYRFPILSHRIELVVRTKPSFSCSADASMHKTDGFVREALRLCRAPRPERCAAAGNERAAHRAGAGPLPKRLLCAPRSSTEVPVRTPRFPPQRSAGAAPDRKSASPQPPPRPQGRKAGAPLPTARPVRRPGRRTA